MIGKLVGTDDCHVCVTNAAALLSLSSKCLYVTVAYSPRVDPVSGLVRADYNDEKLVQVQVVSWEHAALMYKQLRRAWMNVLLRKALGIPIAVTMTTSLSGSSSQAQNSRGLAPHVGGEAAKEVSKWSGYGAQWSLQRPHLGIELTICTLDTGKRSRRTEGWFVADSRIVSWYPARHHEKTARLNWSHVRAIFKAYILF